jgi:hypothetical protein
LRAAKSLLTQKTTLGPISRLTESNSLAAQTRNDTRAASSPANLRLLSRRRRWTRGSPVLKTFPAIDGTPLGGLERNCRFFGALRADCLSFYSLCRTGGSASPRRTACLARFTPLGLVLETLVGEKHLLARSKNKLGRTFGALQDPIVVFHTLLPGKPYWSMAAEQSTPDEMESALL